MVVHKLASLTADIMLAHFIQDWDRARDVSLSWSIRLGSLWHLVKSSPLLGLAKNAIMGLFEVPQITIFASISK
jgi:hypothetical protein